MAAITQVVFGYYAGWYIQLKGKNAGMLRNLFFAALALLAAGYVWSTVFPLNKKIWTSSFVLVSTGYAILLLLVLIFIIEFRHWTGWGTKFFDVFGKNPLFIFVLSGAFPRLLGLIRIPNAAGEKPVWLSPLSWFYKMVCQPLMAGNGKNASLLYALILVLFYWAIGYMLDRRRIYIRV
jgi:predicted acyltransferase